jgi:hypothetical protein
MDWHPLVGRSCTEQAVSARARVSNTGATTRFGASNRRATPLTGRDGGGGIQLGRRLRRRCFRGMDRDIGVELGDPCGAGDPGPGAEEFMQTVYESAVALHRTAHCSVSDTPGYCGHGAGKNLR